MNSEGSLRCLSHFTCDQLALEKEKFEKSPVPVNDTQVPILQDNVIFFICQKEGVSRWSLKLQAKQKPALVICHKQTTQKDHWFQLLL